MKRQCIIVAIVSMLCMCLTVQSQAEIPKILALQGKLTDSSGQALNGSFSITFRIYNASTAGTKLWEETQTLTVSSGIFSALLGSTIPLNLAFDQPYWVEIVVGQEVLSPRQPLAASAYAFRAAQLEGLTVAGGNVGIGTTGPYGKLHVTGIGWGDQTAKPDSSSFPVSGTGGFVLDGGYTNGQYRTRFVKIDRASNLPLYIQQSLNTANSYTNLARFGTHAQSTNVFEVFGNTAISGSVGIGTNAPENRLHIFGDGNQLKLSNSSGSTTRRDDLIFRIDATDIWTVRADNADGNNLKFLGIGGKDYLTLTQAGNLFLGKGQSPNLFLTGNTTASETGIRLHYNNYIQVGVLDVRGNWFALRGVSPATTGDASTPRLFVNLTNGNVGIGTTNPGDYRLYVNGAAYATGGFQGSSIELKTGLRRLNPQEEHALLEKLNQVSIYEYRLKEMDNLKTTHLGIIAEEAPEELVDDGRKALSYGDTLAVLLAAFKAQHAEIQALKKEVGQLKARD